MVGILPRGSPHCGSGRVRSMMDPLSITATLNSACRAASLLLFAGVGEKLSQLARSVFAADLNDLIWGYCRIFKSWLDAIVCLASRCLRMP